ncbi:hypothetical protein B0I37DRAFT_211037 [Chaetomium sp. MPI-CAGE-AT-0009]|nr:hypothetical protein B0I37DRAFT_211037 [Chaetomium sp. MPI-CAGE-AT-0009]
MPDNPSSVLDWEELVKNSSLRVKPANILITNLPTTKSASGLTLDHFLCLKVLCDEKTRDYFLLEDYVDDISIATAKQKLRTPKVKDFLRKIREGSEDYPDDSIFSLVHLYMEFVFDLDSRSDWAQKILLTPDPPRMETDRERTPESPLAGKGTSSMADIGLDVEMMDTSPLAELSPSTDSLVSSSSGGMLPAHPSEFQPTEDETTVNMATVLLLNSLTESDEELRSKGYRWLPNRDVAQIFKSPSTKGARNTGPSHKNGNKLLEARTDGCFRNTRYEISAALLEVKPCIRESSKEKIQWQEGAQMAAHIYKLLYLKTPPRDDFGLLLPDKSGSKRRLFVSQDHAEIYITIAEYDTEYEEYLGLHHPAGSSRPPIVGSRSRHGKAVAGSHHGFLMMNCFGPWRTDKWNDVKDVCEALLAFSIYLAKK